MPSQTYLPRVSVNFSIVNINSCHFTGRMNNAGVALLPRSLGSVCSGISPNVLGSVTKDASASFRSVLEFPLVLFSPTPGAKP